MTYEKIDKINSLISKLIDYNKLAKGLITADLKNDQFEKVIKDGQLKIIKELKHLICQQSQPQ